MTKFIKKYKKKLYFLLFFGTMLFVKGGYEMAENKNTKKSSAKSSTKTTTKKTNTKTTVKKETAKKPAVKSTAKNEVKDVVKNEEKVVETKPIEIKEEKVTEKKEVKKASFIELVKQNATLIVLCAICLLLIINIVLIVNGHKVKLSDGKEVVASINDKTITAEDLFDKMKEQYGTNALVNIIDNEIINREISNTDDVVKKAKEQVSSIKSQYETMGYKWDEVLTNYGYKNEQALVDEIKNSLLKEQVVVNYLSKNLTDEEIKKYYDEKVSDSYTAKHILIIPNTTDSMTDEEKAAAEEEAKNKAIEVINKLNNGEAWKDLVASYSQDTGSKENEGLVENFTKDDVVEEFYNATAKLNDGAYTTEPVKSKFGYHVILRISKTDKEALETMKNELVEQIVNTKLSEDSKLYTTAWDKIRKSYNLEINDTIINDNYEKAIKGE